MEIGSRHHLRRAYNRERMFTAEERERLRADLLRYASVDWRITGAAITGSAAADREDQWSDVDLAFGVADPAEIPAILDEWTAYLYREHLALHHVDIVAGSWTYRVFLLPGTLQVDLAFVDGKQFRALAPTFRLMFGSSLDPAPPHTAATEQLIGMAWLYALHVRTSLARQRWWQAEHMISGLRNHTLALACARRGLDSNHGRGYDLLPPETLDAFSRALVQAITQAELTRASNAALRLFYLELEAVDAKLANSLREPLQLLGAQCSEVRT